MKLLEDKRIDRYFHKKALNIRRYWGSPSSRIERPDIGKAFTWGGEFGSCCMASDGIQHIRQAYANNQYAKYDFSSGVRKKWDNGEDALTECKSPFEKVRMLKSIKRWKR